MNNIRYNEFNKHLEIEFKNNKDETVLIWVNKVKSDKKDKNCLMNLWVENKYLDKFIDEYWHLELFVYTPDGDCVNKYNPQINYNTFKLDFNYILEATQDNLDYLLNKIKEISNK